MLSTTKRLEVAHDGKADDKWLRKELQIISNIFLKENFLEKFYRVFNVLHIFIDSWRKPLSTSIYSMFTQFDITQSSLKIQYNYNNATKSFLYFITRNTFLDKTENLKLYNCQVYN